MSTDFDPTNHDYSSCLVKPMSRDDIISLEHVVDAAIVAGVAFFAILLGDTVFALSTGNSIYLSVADVQARLITAGLAFGLTFCAQWARARGLELKRILNGSNDS
jgi:hypothetical protein